MSLFYYFISEQVILHQLNSGRTSYIVFTIRFSLDFSMEIELQPILKRFFGLTSILWSNSTFFIERVSKEKLELKSDRKSYRTQGRAAIYFTERNYHRTCDVVYTVPITRPLALERLLERPNYRLFIHVNLHILPF